MNVQSIEIRNSNEAQEVSIPASSRLDPRLAVDRVTNSQELARTCIALSAAARQRRKTYLRCQGTLSVAAPCTVGVFLVVGPLILPNIAASVPLMCVIPAALVICLVAIGGYLRATRRNDTIQKLTAKIVSADNTLTTPVLIDILSLDDIQVVSESRKQLTRLAPRWTESDFAALDAEQRDRLRNIVDGLPSARHGDASGLAAGRRYVAERTALRVTLCAVFGRMGNTEDRPALRRAALQPAVTASSRQVRDCAAAALAELDARLALQNRPATLLRASEPPARDEQGLVRAAGPAGAIAADELLRGSRNSG